MSKKQNVLMMCLFPLLLLIAAFLPLACGGTADNGPSQLYWSAEHAYVRGDMDDALNRYQVVLGNPEDSAWANWAQWRMGQIYVSKNDVPSARLVFTDLAGNSTDSSLARDARSILTLLASRDSLQAKMKRISREAAPRPAATPPAGCEDEVSRLRKEVERLYQLLNDR